MRFGSVCSGIEAASMAWKPLGWHPAFVSEIDAFPCELLSVRHPDAPNWGDMTKFHEWPDTTIDVLVGGTPCQSFSVAGLRKGLDDPRGNLMLTYLAIAARYRPEWLVWENVPGVLSSGGGRDFGSLLGGLAELGYGFAYRVLDAQYFGLAQRRQRVFVVGCAGDWRRAAAVLFERASLQGNPAPSRSAGKDTAHELSPSIGASGRGFSRAGETRGQDPVIATQGGVSRSLTIGGRFDYDTETFVTHSLRADGFDASKDGTGHGTPLVPWPQAIADPISANEASTYAHEGKGNFRLHNVVAGAPLTPVANSLGANAGRMQLEQTYLPVAFAQNQRYEVRVMDVDGALAKEAGMKQQTYVNQSMAVRRLTPRECERLQGFPDDYTRIPLRNKDGRQNGKWAKDGPRYKALGNSMAVPVMAWIGRRIAECSKIESGSGRA